MLSLVGRLEDCHFRYIPSQQVLSLPLGPSPHPQANCGLPPSQLIHRPLKGTVSMQTS